MEWLPLLLWLQLLLLLLDIAAVRERLAKLVRLPAAGGDACEVSEEGYELICAKGVSVPRGVLLHALGYARQAGVAVLDLIPEDAAALDLFAYFQLLEVDKVRKRPFAVGRSAGLAMLVSEDVLKRVHAEGARPAYGTQASLITLAKRLKRYAPYACDMLLCPSMGGAHVPLRHRWQALWAHLGSFALQALLFPLLLVALLAWGVRGGRPLLAGCVLLAYHLQPLAALSGLGRGRPASSPWPLLLLRLPMEVCRNVAIVLMREGVAPAGVDSGVAEAKAQKARAVYAEDLKEGLARFFEPPRGDCPLCGSERLGQILCSPDHIQYKPGLFYLSRCGSCGHVFQNPRLTPEGLSFYYRDAYEGLNTETMEWIYDIQEARYLERAELVARQRPRGGAAAAPERWLDVGGCHGHFCCAARQPWPETKFELLDWAEAVQEAARRGWADKVYQGQFLQLASSLEGRFDVISMSHYLEHSTEPWAEIDAAHRVLKEGGHFFIELPDPECRLGLWMGSLWQSWLQPQHLHLPPMEALEALLQRHGFEVVERQRKEANIRSDVMFFMAKALNSLVLTPDLSGAPWLPPEPPWRRVLRQAVWWLPGGVALAVGWLTDMLCGPLILRLAGSNTYRLLAVRRPLPTKE